MHIEVVVFATLRKYLPDLKLGETRPLELPPGTTICQVRDMLGLPANEVKVVMRNNRQAELNDVLQDGDRIAFIPAAGGG